MNTAPPTNENPRMGSEGDSEESQEHHKANSAASSSQEPPTPSPTANRADIDLTIDLICEPRGVYELRVLKGSNGDGVVAGCFDDRVKLADEAERQSGRAKGVYVTLNRLSGNLGRPLNEVVTHAKDTAKDTDIARRTRLLIDVDPVRPKNVSSTTAEKAAARDAAARIHDYLARRGWFEPIFADSGNGYHLVYAIDLPNNDAGKTLVKAILKKLDTKFSTPAAKVDTTVYNASRISKLYGTMARKGRDTQERPHRLSALIETPTIAMMPVKRKQLEALAALAGEQPHEETAAEETIAEETVAEAAAGKSTSAGTASFTFNPKATRFKKLDTLFENDIRARNTYDGKRPDLKDQSPSGYDLALADACVLAGFNDQEVVDAMVARRREHGIRLKSPANFALTLKKARAGMKPVSDEHGEDGEDDDAGPGGRGPRVKQSEQIVALAADVELWHSEKPLGFATVAMEDGHHCENMMIQSKPFRDLLRKRFYDRTHKLPAGQALIDAVAFLDGRALYEGPCYPVSIRVAESGGNVYLDLLDAHWQAIEITPCGWQVVAKPPVRFLRREGMQALPIPVHGGSIEALRPFVNASDELFILAASWLIGALNPRGPYIVGTLLGPQGSGKSILAQILRLLIDPNKALLASIPREERDLAVIAFNGYTVAIDNISRLPEWLSNALSKLSTTGGFSTRENYSDDRLVIFERRVPILLTGISGVATRPDLLSRAALITLTPIHKSKRFTEERLFATFNDAAPLILGALLDAVVAALAGRGKVPAQLPRMADAAAWICAASAALPWTEDAFLEAYEQNQAEAVEIALEADSIGDLIPRFMRATHEWRGTATELLAALDSFQSDGLGRRPLDWPKTPEELSGRVIALGDAFLSMGITVRKVTGHGKKRFLVLENTSATSRDGALKPVSIIGSGR